MYEKHLLIANVDIGFMSYQKFDGIVAICPSSVMKR